jgi:hypothetical protein
MNRISRQCGILSISQPHRLPWPVTGIALIDFYPHMLHDQQEVCTSFIIETRSLFREKVGKMIKVKFRAKKEVAMGKQQVPNMKDGVGEVIQIANYVLHKIICIIFTGNDDIRETKMQT